MRLIPQYVLFNNTDSKPNKNNCDVVPSRHEALKKSSLAAERERETSSIH